MLVSTMSRLRACLGRIPFDLLLLLLLSLNCRLLLPHGVVATLQRQQLLMRATLDNIALVEDHDLVGGSNGGKTVSATCLLVREPYKAY